MYKTAKMFTLFTETPLHAGSGSELGVIDLPIQRERHTEFPKIEGSSLKGALRAAFEHDNNNGEIALTFGPEDGDLHAGALGFTDARLLLFPVKSMKGVFGWITCPHALNRFMRDLELAGGPDSLTVPSAKSCIENTDLQINTKVILEEYTFDVRQSGDLQKLAAWIADHLLPAGDEYDYWRKKMKKDVVVLSDDDFRDFVTLSTEVITRTKISSETGTVVSGALFTEEYLPTETLLYSLALATPVMVDEDKAKKNGNAEPKGPFAGATGDEQAKKVMAFFADKLPAVVQVGGSATIGKGLLRTRVVHTTHTAKGGN